MPRQRGTIAGTSALVRRSRTGTSASDLKGRIWQKWLYMAAKNAFFFFPLVRICLDRPGTLAADNNHPAILLRRGRVTHGGKKTCLSDALAICCSPPC